MDGMHQMRLAALASLLLLAPVAPAQREASAKRHHVTAADSSFGRLIERLSEPGGYFDTDNLISNESAYLHVLGTLHRVGVSGGAYIGVGPDQNFSYIAQLRPTVAYILDIRRDNLLQHLMFKSLFALSRNRLEYLCRLFARPVPRDLHHWDQRSITELIAYLDETPQQPELVDASLAAVRAKAASLGVPLSDKELATIGRIHATFIDAGPDLRFSSIGRPPRPYYPTYRQLLLEKDLAGRQANYLASEDDFRFLKTLQARNLVVPVVGNFAGAHALREIARDVGARGERVSAFYTSNVEYYLMREGSFDRFAENLKRLPRTARSVVIRSYFGGVFGSPHPQSVPGYYNTQLVQSLDAMLDEYDRGGYRTYLELVTRHHLDR